MPSAATAQIPQTADETRQMANAIRALAMDAVEAAQSGHPGMPMGMADVATVLFSRFLKFDAGCPDWADRDRFILSGGHGSMLLYALSYLTGYEAMTIDDIRKFRQLHSRTPGHPERDIAIGAEMTTGPLGQGIATAVGFALAERLLNARFGNDLVDHKTYVMAGDGDLMEGISHEACALAGHLKLSSLIVLYDDNKISIDGSTDLSFTEDVLKRFDAYGWATARVDGHDPEAVAQALERAQTADRPTLIACRTRIGFGAPTKEGTEHCHGSPLGAAEVAGAREKLGWPHAPFEIPSDILQHWRAIGSQNRATRAAWEARHQANASKDAFDAAMTGDLSARIAPLVAEIKSAFTAKPTPMASRKSSGLVLEKLVPAIAELIGGSADLSGSNLTQVKGIPSVTPNQYAGQYIHYGVREHGMAAIMNGLALHGGVVPYGGTFLSFADYCRPSIRLAALMKTRSIFVMTHDSIGLGEDGPTHQPVEHLASLRVIPNLLVFRPADAVETAECWQIALNTPTAPSLLALTRQNLPLQRTTHTDENLCARGGYILAEAEGGAPQVVLMATGSEVAIAMTARSQLQEKGIPTRLVSLPCMELFARQDQSWRDQVLGPAGALRIGVEAALVTGWERWLGEKGRFIGMTGFGESAPADALYAHFGITADKIVETALAAR